MSEVQVRVEVEVQMTNNTSNTINDGKVVPRPEEEAEFAVHKKRVDDSERDARRSFYWNLSGNIVVFVVLFAYIIDAWILYKDTSYNRQTVVEFKTASTVKMPAIFFQQTQYGTLEKVHMKIFEKNCKVTDKNNPLNISYTTFITPSATNLATATSGGYKNSWLLVNSSLSYYGFDGYGFDFSNYTASYGDYSYYYRRRLLNGSSSSTNSSGFNYNNYYGGAYGGYYYGNYYFNLFSNFSFNDYYTSTSSNIYYIIPPENYKLETFNNDKCGDIFRAIFLVSVPTSAFKSLNLNNFTRDLYVRAYPDSFGFQYGWDERSLVINSYTSKEHVYYSGRLTFGQMKSEELELKVIDDRVDSNYFEYYDSVSSLDYTNVNDNLTFVANGKIYFACYLYIYGNDFYLKFTTVKLEHWYDVISNIGGMYGTISGPIAFFLAAWLYGFSLAFINIDGRAPLDPLSDDLVRRLDSYIATKIDEGLLAPGDKWKPTENNNNNPTNQ